MPAHWYTVRNPQLAELRDDLFERANIPAPMVGGSIDERALELLDEAHASQVKRTTVFSLEDYQARALEVYNELREQMPAMQRRARARQAVADYLRSVVYPAIPMRKYLHYAALLERARPWSLYGIDPLTDKAVVQAMQRAGQVKLCPDDARSEAMRASHLYTPALKDYADAGLEIHSAVFTIENVPAWHLAAGYDVIFERFKREILFARDDGRQAKSMKDPKRRFPGLLGAWACIETPLSGRYVDDPAHTWNVHLNVLLVFNGKPDYGHLRRVWRADVRFRRLGARRKNGVWLAPSTEEIEKSVRELIKYPLKTIAEKSLEKAHKRRDKRTGRQIPPAPPMIFWPPDRFHEWWSAHERRRRSRSWGCLNSQRWPKPARRDLDLCDWFGKLIVTPSRCEITFPWTDTRERDQAQADAAARRSEAVNSILGNNSAGSGYRGRAQLHRERGPP